MLFGQPTTRGGAKRFIDFARHQGYALDQCWALVDRRGRIAHAVLALPNPGRTALLFVSAALDDPDPLADLLAAVTPQLDPARVVVAQALLSHEQRDEYEAFSRAGFTRLADLAYMERLAPKPSAIAPPDWPQGCVIETWSPENDADFATAVKRSYVETHDCPGLCGLRSIADIMRGHRSAGVFDPSMWTLVRMQGAPAAALLLSPMSEQRMVELTYIGVDPDFRSLGLARRLVNRALSLVAHRHERTVTLAVDERNEPALRLYRQAGFYRTDRRVALIHPIPRTARS